MNFPRRPLRGLQPSGPYFLRSRNQALPIEADVEPEPEPPLPVPNGPLPDYPVPDGPGPDEPTPGGSGQDETGSRNRVWVDADQTFYLHMQQRPPSPPRPRPPRPQYPYDEEELIEAGRFLLHRSKKLRDFYPVQIPRAACPTVQNELRQMRMSLTAMRLRNLTSSLTSGAQDDLDTLYLQECDKLDEAIESVIEMQEYYKSLLECRENRENMEL